MRDFLKFHHICYAYMGVQKEQKCTCLTAFEHREKEARNNIDIAVVSECLCHLRAQYSVQLSDISSG